MSEKRAFLKLLDEQGLKSEMVEGYKILHQDRPDIVNDVDTAFAFLEKRTG